MRDSSASPAQLQDHIVFTYDDVRCAQNVPQLVPPPNRIISIREARYKLARYYDGDGIEPDQWEMYDLERDPDERVNLAFPGSETTTITYRLAVVSGSVAATAEPDATPSP